VGEHVLPQALALLSSPLLQGAAVGRLQDLLKALVATGGAGQLYCFAAN
jgi:hypothetical protein